MPCSWYHNIYLIFILFFIVHLIFFDVRWINACALAKNKGKGKKIIHISHTEMCVCACSFFPSSEWINNNTHFYIKKTSIFLLRHIIIVGRRDTNMATLIFSFLLNFRFMPMSVLLCVCAFACAFGIWFWFFIFHCVCVLFTGIVIVNIYVQAVWSGLNWTGFAKCTSYGMVCVYGIMEYVAVRMQYALIWLLYVVLYYKILYDFRFISCVHWKKWIMVMLTKMKEVWRFLRKIFF